MKIMAKSLFMALFIGTVMNLAVSVTYAQSPTTGTTPKNAREKVQERIQNLKGKFVHLAGTKVEAVSGATLTVSKDGKTYTVNTDSNTRFRRLFWGKSSLAEISVGDNVNIWGKWADEAQTTINAQLIRNTSVMKRYGVFLGDVKSKGTDSFVLSSKNRNDQTVYFDAGTKFVNRKGETITYNDVKVGDRVRVRGLWDKTLSKITEVKEVKDYFLPTKPAGTTQ